MDFQDRFARVVLRHPFLVLISFLVLAGVSISLLPDLRQNPSPYLLDEHHPSRVSFEALRNNYTGSRDSVMVMLESETTVFTQSTLRRVMELTEAFEGIRLITEKDISLLRQLASGLNEQDSNRLLAALEDPDSEEFWEQLEEVQDLIPETLFKEISLKLSPTIEVSSMANTDNIVGVEGGLEVEPIYEEVPESEEELRQIQKAVMGNELFRKVLVGGDGKYTSIFLELAIDEEDSKGQLLMLKKVEEILAAIPGEEKHYIAGTPVVTASMSETMEKDTRQLFPVVLLIVILCLWFSFRMFKGVLVPILVVLFSLVFTLALKVVFDVPINIITSTLPVFILSIGVADGIHLFSEFRDYLMEGLSKEEAIAKTLRELTVPVVMTSITTAAAFYSLSITEIVQLKHFGLYVAIGTMVAMALSLLFVPALLMILPQKSLKNTKKKSSPIDHWINHLLETTSRNIVRRPKTVLWVTAAIVLAGVIGTVQVRVDNDAINYFEEDTSLVISTNQLNQHGAGSNRLNLLIRFEEEERTPFKNPKHLKLLEQLNDFLMEQPQVGKVLGIVPLVQRINHVMNDNDPAKNKIPEATITVQENRDGKTLNETISGKDLVAQYLLLYENGGGDTVTDVMDSGYRQANVSILLKTNSSYEINQLVEKIRQWEQENLNETFHLEFSGFANVMNAATKEIVNGQIISFLISIVVTFMLLIFTFRSLSIGFLALFPLLSTTIVNFGIMGFFEIPLNIGTALISSIVIGIGVDYSIHYISRWQENMKNGMNFEEAILKTVRHSGKAIVSNAFTVGIGFLALLFSVLTPLFTMGWMISMTMLVSALCTIVLIPAVLSLSYNKQTATQTEGKISQLKSA